jgi:hypothetical protein
VKNRIVLPAGVTGKMLSKARRKRIRDTVERQGGRFGGANRIDENGAYVRVSAPVDRATFIRINAELHPRRKKSKSRRRRPWWFHPNAPRVPKKRAG